jgi:hypothetical protein
MTYVPGLPNTVNSGPRPYSSAREFSKLDPTYEKALAEEGGSGEIDEWPKY